MGDRIFRLLILFIDVFFFLFYITIMAEFVEVDYIAFPYIILTIYFIVATFTHPFIGLETEDKFSHTKIPNSKYTLIFAYIFAPIVYIYSLIKNNDSE
ncbi:hypothetical protein [Jeotgalicoccus sp. S0W5]|uniref:hypothetical protein n=1 Tax=Jeotgalicoccus sp. S0W5 TaxID=2527874 RepID=UPI001414F996|nr:hypothetical protein [Jeotgalicoccus sp. S0W5]